MSDVRIDIKLTGSREGEAVLQALRNGLARRGGLHAAMAVPAQQMTQDFLLRMQRHKTAERLGARPTNFRQKNAKLIQADSDEAGAYVRIPRNTGLGRAFHPVDIVPRAGRKFLTLPADPRTYGRSVRDFPEGTFRFQPTGAQRKTPALVFAIDGKVAYWLKRKVHQAQDRSLLPSDAASQEVGRRAAIAYITNLTKGPQTLP